VDEGIAALVRAHRHAERDDAVGELRLHAAGNEEQLARAVAPEDRGRAIGAGIVSEAADRQRRSADETGQVFCCQRDVGRGSPGRQRLGLEELGIDQAQAAHQQARIEREAREIGHWFANARAANESRRPG
jgi:hypothetical protein